MERAQRLANLGEIAANVANEINNPLQVVLGRAELLLMAEQPTKEEMRESLKIIQDQCSRARNIIKQMHIISNPAIRDIAVVDINECVEEVAKLMEYQLSLNGIELRRKYGSGPILVRMDENKMQQVILNLLRNAADAIEKKGAITVTTQKKEGKALVDISDTGRGIPKDMIKKVFDPFFTTKDGSTGLGLSISYSIIKAHNGEIRIANNVLGRGAAVSINLPVAGE